MMPAEIFESNDSNEYQKAFRKMVFTLLKKGYDRLDAASFKDAHEEDITGELVKKINESLEERGAKPWMTLFSVHEDPRANTPERRGKHRKRVDIEFERVGIGPRPRYSFEAKRLCRSTHPISLYIGPTGLGEFLSGSYANHQSEAGMLGYIQSDTPEIWSKKVKKIFEETPEKVNTYPEGNWSNVTIIHDLDHCFRSKHYRTSDASPITIYHVFFVF